MKLVTARGRGWREGERSDRKSESNIAASDVNNTIVSMWVSGQRLLNCTQRASREFMRERGVCVLSAQAYCLARHTSSNVGYSSSANYVIGCETCLQMLTASNDVFPSDVMTVAPLSTLTRRST